MRATPTCPSALVSEINRRTGLGNSTIRRLLTTGGHPRNPMIARAWDRALAAAKAKLAKAKP